MIIENGKAVSIEYTLTLEDKEVIDTNVGKAPLTYIQGNNQIIPGLESELTGMAAGETKDVIVAPENAYGPVQKQALVEVKKDRLPEESRDVGKMVQSQGPSGQDLRGVVSEIKDDTAIVDFNHPLAGKTLNFAVKVLEIKTPEKSS